MVPKFRCYTTGKKIFTANKTDTRFHTFLNSVFKYYCEKRFVQAILTLFPELDWLSRNTKPDFNFNTIRTQTKLGGNMGGALPSLLSSYNFVMAENLGYFQEELRWHHLVQYLSFIVLTIGCYPQLGEPRVAYM